MSHYGVGCDAHRRCSQFAILDRHGRVRQQTRVDHEPGATQAFLEKAPQRHSRRPGKRRQLTLDHRWD